MNEWAKARVSVNMQTTVFTFVKIVENSNGNTGKGLIQKKAEALLICFCSLNFLFDQEIKHSGKELAQSSKKLSKHSS